MEKNPQCVVNITVYFKSHITVHYCYKIKKDFSHFLHFVVTLPFMKIAQIFHLYVNCYKPVTDCYVTFIRIHNTTVTLGTVV